MGLIKDKIYYTYEDVTIMPNVISLIEHRSECIPLDEEGMLPLFTAPMNTVVNSKNFGMFEDEMIQSYQELNHLLLGLKTQLGVDGRLILLLNLRMYFVMRQKNLMKKTRLKL